MKLKDGINGFCMALADSVPGVSGGTVAFIMGFYDKFIGSIERLVFGGMEEKKDSLKYLLRLGAGWVIGMGLAVVILTSLFQTHIYVVSSVFVGFIAGAIPLIILDEKESFSKVGKGLPFLFIGALIVIAVTAANGAGGDASMDLSQFSIGLGIRLFLTGMVAISAMFLPGISGSTMLLVFGAYIPVMTALKGVMKMDMSYLPALLFFICGILAGAATVVKVIRICLERFRPQMIYLILGMMIGSFYSIFMGPTTLAEPQPAMNIFTFSFVGAAAGAAVVFALQYMRDRQVREDNDSEDNNAHDVKTADISHNKAHEMHHNAARIENKSVKTTDAGN